MNLGIRLGALIRSSKRVFLFFYCHPDNRREEGFWIPCAESLLMRKVFRTFSLHLYILVHNCLCLSFIVTIFACREPVEKKVYYMLIMDNLLNVRRSVEK